MFTKSRTKANQCAKEIINWLIAHELWDSVCVYVDGGCYTSECASLSLEERIDRMLEGNYAPAKEVYWEENKNPRDYFEYVAKPHFLSMSFEGGLYGVLNYHYSLKYCDKLEEELSNIFEKYGYYYELGNAWNLTAAKL